MGKLGLHLFEANLRFLPSREVTNEAGEDPTMRGARFADRELHRKGRAIAPLPDGNASDTDDSSLASHQVSLHVTPVLPPIGLRHQDLDVLTDRFVLAKPEEIFRGRTERHDNANLIDHDHRVGNRGENRMEKRLARCARSQFGQNDAPHGACMASYSYKALRAAVVPSAQCARRSATGLCASI